MYYVKYDGPFFSDLHFFNEKENAVQLAKETFIDIMQYEYNNDEQIINLYKNDLLAIEQGDYSNDNLEIAEIETED